MSLKVIQSRVHDKVLLLRKIEHLINTPHFEKVYKACDSDSQKYVNLCINSLNLSALRLWLKSNQIKDPEELTVPELRDLARVTTIQNYTGLLKSELINALRKAGVLND